MWNIPRVFLFVFLLLFPCALCKVLSNTQPNYIFTFDAPQYTSSNAFRVELRVQILDTSKSSLPTELTIDTVLCKLSFEGGKGIDQPVSLVAHSATTQNCQKKCSFSISVPYILQSTDGKDRRVFGYQLACRVLIPKNEKPVFLASNFVMINAQRPPSFSNLNPGKVYANVPAHIESAFKECLGAMPFFAVTHKHYHPLSPPLVHNFGGFEEILSQLCSHVESCDYDAFKKSYPIVFPPQDKHAGFLLEAENNTALNNDRKLFQKKVDDQRQSTLYERSCSWSSSASSSCPDVSILSSFVDYLADNEFMSDDLFFDQTASDLEQHNPQVNEQFESCDIAEHSYPDPFSIVQMALDELPFDFGEIFGELLARSRLQPTSQNQLRIKLASKTEDKQSEMSSQIRDKLLKLLDDLYKLPDFDEISSSKLILELYRREKIAVDCISIQDEDMFTLLANKASKFVRKKKKTVKISL